MNQTPRTKLINLGSNYSQPVGDGETWEDDYLWEDAMSWGGETVLNVDQPRTFLKSIVKPFLKRMLKKESPTRLK